MNLKMLSAICAFSLSAALSAQSIVLPNKPSKAEKTAAAELSEHLTKMLGRKVAVTNESKPGVLPRIYVGNTKFAGKKKFDLEAWQIRTKGKNALILQGGNPNGILYAAWELLEQNGVLWMDEETTYIPKKKALTWKANWNISGKPAFAIRGIYSYLKEGHLRKPNYLFQMRNRLNMVARVPGYELAPTFGSPGHCHTYAAYTKDWKGKETECFAMNKSGKRLPPAGNQIHGQICFTNPKTLQLFAKKLREYIKTDRANGHYTNYYDVSQNDNSDECYCTNCQNAIKRYKSFGGLILEFTNKLAENIAKDYPEVKIQMFAYHTAAKVPVNIKAHKNVIVRIPLMGAEFLGVQTRDTSRPLTHPNNKQDLAILLGWQKIATIAIWDYWIMFKNNGIASFHNTIAKNIRFISEDHGSDFATFASNSDREYPSFLQTLSHLVFISGVSVSGSQPSCR